MKLTDESLINSAHDISDGGIAVALAECCIMNRDIVIGCEINLGQDVKKERRKDFELFAETQSCIIVSADQGKIKRIKVLADELDIDILEIGETGGNRLKINFDIDMPLREAEEAYYNSISGIME